MENNASTGPVSDKGPAPETVIRDNTVEDRFELFVNGMPAGVLAYRIQGEKYALTHTEIDPEFEGRGMGSKLISGTLDQIRAAGHTILPICPFVLSFLQRHDDYLDVVAATDRARFELPAA
jgi:predicted GNAT family acetyltransferase